MNVYDFDQTVFYPDSSYCFTRWCLNRHPQLYLLWLPEMALIGLLYLFHLVSKERFKEAIFSYLPHLKDVEKELKLFWKNNEKRMSRWYLRQKREDDIIISASPDFLLRPLTDKLGVELIASGMDMHSGKSIGPVCGGREKVHRFYEDHPDGEVKNFYSDSYKDTPMAELAENAYMVKNKGRTVVPWKFK